MNLELTLVLVKTKYVGEREREIMPCTAGCTSVQHKAVNLLHSILLEVGSDPLLIEEYCAQVIGCLSDQGLTVK